MTSSDPIRYAFVAKNRSSFNRRESEAGGGVEGTTGGGSGDGTDPPLEGSSAARGTGVNAAVSIRDAGDGMSSRGRASSFGGDGRTVGGEGWATFSLFAGGGDGAMAVAGGGVDGTAGGGSGGGTDPLRGVSMMVNRYLKYAPGPPSPMDDGAGIAADGTPAGRGSEGVCISVVNRLSVSPGPPSIRGESAFWGIVAQPNPDIRKRRMAITSRRAFLMRINTFIFNDMRSTEPLRFG